jgi:RNA polymerase sigma factor (sigma-70 family)
MGLGPRFGCVLAAAQTGAEWALTALYRDLHPAVLRYLYSQDPTDAEDLASDTWLDVARGLQRFGGDETAFRRWVFTIARRRLLDNRRASTRRRTHPIPVEALHLEAPDCADEAMAFAPREPPWPSSPVFLQSRQRSSCCACSPTSALKTLRR